MSYKYYIDEGGRRAGGKLLRGTEFNNYNGRSGTEFKNYNGRTGIRLEVLLNGEWKITGGSAKWRATLQEITHDEAILEQI